MKSPPRSKFGYRIYDETSENVNDEMDEHSISNKGKGTRRTSKINSFSVFKKETSKEPLSKSESQMLRDEMDKLRQENEEILSQFKELKVSHALALENKTENEQSMLNEIRILHGKLGGRESRAFDDDSESRSQYDTGVFNLDEIRRDSYSKPLSEFAETTSAFAYSETKKTRRNRQLK